MRATREQDRGEIIHRCLVAALIPASKFCGEAAHIHTPHTDSNAVVMLAPLQAQCLELKNTDRKVRARKTNGACTPSHEPSPERTPPTRPTRDAHASRGSQRSLCDSVAWRDAHAGLENTSNARQTLKNRILWRCSVYGHRSMGSGAVGVGAGKVSLFACVARTSDLFWPGCCMETACAPVWATCGWWRRVASRHLMGRCGCQI